MKKPQISVNTQDMVVLVESSPNYIHFLVGQTWYKEEDAKAHMAMIQHLIDTLAKTYKVFIRRCPQMSKEIDFEKDYYEWKTSARFSIISGDNVGIVKSMSYDNNNVLMGFGLSDNSCC
jgi:hypothetical protein